MWLGGLLFFPTTVWLGTGWYYYLTLFDLCIFHSLFGLASLGACETRQACCVYGVGEFETIISTLPLFRDIIFPLKMSPLSFKGRFAEMCMQSWCEISQHANYDTYWLPTFNDQTSSFDELTIGSDHGRLISSRTLGCSCWTGQFNRSVP